MITTSVAEAATCLKKGQVLAYPTEAVWGLGCDATNEDAVDKINKIKGRAADKSLIVLLANSNNLQSYISEIPEVGYELIEYAENPLTIIFSGAKNLAKNVINNESSSKNPC